MYKTITSSDYNAFFSTINAEHANLEDINIHADVCLPISTSSNIKPAFSSGESFSKIFYRNHIDYSEIYWYDYQDMRPYKEDISALRLLQRGFSYSKKLGIMVSIPIGYLRKFNDILMQHPNIEAFPAGHDHNTYSMDVLLLPTEKHLFQTISYFHSTIFNILKEYNNSVSFFNSSIVTDSNILNDFLNKKNLETKQRSQHPSSYIVYKNKNNGTVIYNMNNATDRDQCIPYYGRLRYLSLMNEICYDDITASKIMGLFYKHYRSPQLQLFLSKERLTSDPANLINICESVTDLVYVDNCNRNMMLYFLNENDFYMTKLLS